MKNILPKYVHARRISAVRLTPVKIASNGTAWSARNGIELTQFTRRAARGADGLPDSGCGASSTFVATRPLSVMMDGGRGRPTDWYVAYTRLDQPAAAAVPASPS